MGCVGERRGHAGVRRRHIGLVARSAPEPADLDCRPERVFGYRFASCRALFAGNADCPLGTCMQLPLQFCGTEMVIGICD